MADDGTILADYPDSAAVFSLLHGFDMGNNTLRKKAEEPVPVEGRAIVQAEGKFREILRNFVFLLFSKFGWGHAIALFQQRIETAQAFEPASVSDGGDWHSGIGENLLCQKQALRLGKLNGRNAKFVLKDAAHLAIRDPEFFGEFGEGMFGQEILAN
jgi:hypothetical protein